MSPEGLKGKVPKLSKEEAGVILPVASKPQNPKDPDVQKVLKDLMKKLDESPDGVIIVSEG